MQDALIALFLTLVFGVLSGWLFYRIFRAGILYSAENEAAELIQEAKDKNELQLLEEKERVQEIETELWTKEEPQLLKLEERIEELESIAEEKKQSADNQYSQVRQKAVEYENQITKDESRIDGLNKKHQDVKSKIKALNDNYISALCSNLKINKEEIINEITQTLIKETQERGQSS